jgi:hypothetical protein
LASAFLQLKQIAADPRLPPNVRSGAAELEVAVESLLTKADQRWQAVLSFLEEVTTDWEVEDIKWIELRQRATDQPLLQITEQRFAQTAARALRKAAERETHSGDYLTAAERVAAGEWHYLDLIPYLRCAPIDLKLSERRASALQRSQCRLQAVYRYREDQAAADQA